MTLRQSARRLFSGPGGLATDRIEFLAGWRPSPSVTMRLRAEHPALSDAQSELVVDALRQWFRLFVRSQRGTGGTGAARPGLAMPSVVVDDLWHELVLHTRDYDEFCGRAFGRFLHHQPESAMPSAAAHANRTSVMWDTFRQACRDDPALPARGVLPLCFGIDEFLGVPGGRRFVIACGTPGVCSAGAGVTADWAYATNQGGAAAAARAAAAVVAAEAAVAVTEALG